jgi:hypothetical protein
MSRLQDRRFDQRETKPEGNALRVSDMIAADLLLDFSSLDHDADVQEAIRLSLLESSSSASEHVSPVTLKKAAGAASHSKEKSASQKGKLRPERVPQGAAKKPSAKTAALNSLENKKKSSPPQVSAPSPLPLTTGPPLPFSLTGAGEQEPQRCLICDELFDSEEHLYAFGSCDHASICGVGLQTLPSCFPSPSLITASTDLRLSIKMYSSPRPLRDVQGVSRCHDLLRDFS